MKRSSLVCRLIPTVSALVACSIAASCHGSSSPAEPPPDERPVRVCQAFSDTPFFIGDQQPFVAMVSAFDGESVWVAFSQQRDEADPPQYETRYARFGCDGSVLIPPSLLLDGRGTPVIASSAGRTMIGAWEADWNTNKNRIRLAIFNQDAQQIAGPMEVDLEGLLGNLTEVKLDKRGDQGFLLWGQTQPNTRDQLEPYRPFFRALSVEGKPLAAYSTPAPYTKYGRCAEGWSVAGRSDGNVNYVQFAQNEDTLSSVRFAVVAPTESDGHQRAKVLRNDVPCGASSATESRAGGRTYLFSYGVAFNDSGEWKPTLMDVERPEHRYEFDVPEEGVYLAAVRAGTDGGAAYFVYSGFAFALQRFEYDGEKWSVGTPVRWAQADPTRFDDSIVDYHQAKEHWYFVLRWQSPSHEQHRLIGQFIELP